MTAKQMKDLLNNMSKKTGINAQILQRNFMLERLLERISLSEYKHNIILKGGMSRCRGDRCLSICGAYQCGCARSRNIVETTGL